MSFPNGNQLGKLSGVCADSGTASSSRLVLPGQALAGDNSFELYGYDGFNRMVSANMSGAVTTYAYRPDGLRHSKTTGGVTTTHVWDGSNIALDISGSSVVKYVRGINLLFSDTAGVKAYFLYNGHGDVVNLTSAAGTVTKTYDYDAFGVERNPSAADANPWRYCGEYFDKETGTVYLRARVYDPGIGRFLTEDPAGDGLNWYTYCGGNPVNYWDPSGHYAGTKTLESDGGAGGGAALFYMLYEAGKIVLATIAGTTFVTYTKRFFDRNGNFVDIVVQKEQRIFEQDLQNGVVIVDGKPVPKAPSGSVAGGSTPASPPNPDDDACFIAGTVVSSDSGLVPIESIKVGDSVYSENPETGEKGLKTVLRTFKKEIWNLVNLYVDGEIIVTTENHPFWVEGLDWVGASYLKPGDTLVMQNGSRVTVEKVEIVPLIEPTLVYNIEVEDWHTYYVSECKILVHNQNYWDPNTLKTVAELLKGTGKIPTLLRSPNTKGVDMNSLIKKTPGELEKMYRNGEIDAKTLKQIKKAFENRDLGPGGRRC